MHKKIEKRAAKALDKDAKHYAKEAKHATGAKKKHEKIEMKEAKHASKVIKGLVKKAHEY